MRNRKKYINKKIYKNNMTNIKKRKKMIIGSIEYIKKS